MRDLLVACFILAASACSPPLGERCVSFCEEQKSCPGGDPEDCDDKCEEVERVSESGCEAEASAYFDCLEETGACSNWDDICRQPAEDFSECASDTSSSGN